jgi:SAM-dependent methyltransferase
MQRLVEKIRRAVTVYAIGALSDDEWLRVLHRSIQDRYYRRVRLPGFPTDELQNRSVGSAGEHALTEASIFYAFVKAACQRHDAPISARTRILDFGLGWGRIVRFFMKETSHLFGVDTDEEMLATCRDTDCPASVSKIDPLGSLPYHSGSFDVVYAYSVFTHLPADVQDRWLAEIKRVLRPGGMFVATVEPPRFIDTFLSTDLTKADIHPWHRAMATTIQANPSLKETLAAQGFVYIPGHDRPESYGDSVSAPSYVRSHWSEFFEVLDYLDDPERFWQAVVTARAR